MPTDVAIGPPPPLDAEVSAARAALGEASPRQIMTAAAQSRSGRRSDVARIARALREAPGLAEPSLEELTLDGEYEVVELRVSGPPAQPDVSLLVCRPTGGSVLSRPAIYYIHGGGLIAGSSRSQLREQLELARCVEAVVVSVEYRLAPENPAPAPAEDCYAGLTGFIACAEDFGVDARSIVVAGTSAGGGLAAVTCLMARDRGGPDIAGQLLMTPMLDARNDTVSSLQMTGIDTWDRLCNEIGWASLLPHREALQSLDPYESPASATDLGRLPPTMLDVGSAETFRDEVVTFAARIWAAGGIAELHVWPGGFHGFEYSAPQSRLGQLAWDARRHWLQRVLQV